jgi:glycosyltransferase involved in cell wall biosynthesis
MSQQIAIVTPVFDDWEAFATLIAEIAHQLDGRDIAFHVIAVDDGSSIAPEPAAVAVPTKSCIAEIEVLRLALNLGHQRAIATGLCAVADRRDIDAVVVMDCDGEDRPEDIAELCDASRGNPGWIVLAHRSKRSESLGFRLGYTVYKLLFHALTGRVINFGNYAMLPIKAVRRLVHMPELWNNLPAAIMRSRVPYVTVPTARGQRYAGQSKMNLVSLAVHGLSAMSVYTDMIFVRTLIAAAVVAGLSVLGIIAVILIRFVTDLAVPGWATTVVGNLLIVLLQTVVIVIATSLMMLSGRSNRPIVPIIDAWSFVAERQQRARDRDADAPSTRALR